MKIIRKEFTDQAGLIEITDTEPYFVNSLRRVLLSEIPKLAIQDVIIYDNNSPLFDEIIAHRLSMIPIPTDLPLLVFRDKCSCGGEGCPSCTVRYTLSKEGEGMIYSGDLMPETKDWTIKDKKIPIVKLGKDQRIILEVEAVLGRGRQHAKWQAVQCPSYFMSTTITFDEGHARDVKDLLHKLPSGLVELKGNEILLHDQKKIAILESYIDSEDMGEFIHVTRDPTHILFSFETDGSLKAKDAFDEAVKIMQEKYDAFAKELKTLK